MVFAHWRHLLLQSLVLIAPAACNPATSTHQSVARTDAIGTDLPDDGSPNKAVELYWVTDDTIFRGRCPDRTVILRSQCTVDLQSMHYAGFKTTLDGGLSDTIRELQAEARQIQDAISSLNSQIQSVLDQIHQIEQQTGPLSQQLQDLQARMQNFQVIVNDYQNQLTLIDQSLQKAVDQDMQQLRTYVLSQLTNFQTQLSSISTKVQDLMQQLHDAQAGLDKLREQADQLNIRLSNLNNDLAVVQTKLTAAIDDFSVYEDTLDKLVSGIDHPILSDNPWWQKTRQFVRRFDKIFAQN